MLEGEPTGQQAAVYHFATIGTCVPPTLAVPRFRLNTYDRLAFRIAWNFLQYFVRDSTSSTGFLGVYSKRTCFCNTGAPSSALGEVLGDSATAAIKMFGDKLVLRRNITAGCP